jgi:superfamily I DNA/RNA helicase
LAKELINSADPDWWKGQKIKDDDFWNNEVPLKLLDTPVPEDKKFDTIIVDEGQDFKADWFTNLLDLLKDANDGRFVVFYDENQDIFGHWENIPWGNTGVTRKILTKNCRNSRAIHSYLDELISSNTQPAGHCPEGEAVVIHRRKNAHEELELTKAILGTLLNDSVPPGDIA